MRGVFLYIKKFPSLASLREPSLNKSNKSILPQFFSLATTPTILCTMPEINTDYLSMNSTLINKYLCIFNPIHISQIPLRSLFLSHRPLPPN